MVPVALSLTGAHFDRITLLFIGWFGPRGLASIVFVLLALESLDSAGVDTEPLLPVVTWTVLLSIVLHGFSARSLARRFGHYAGKLPPGSPEFQGDAEPQMHQSMMTLHGDEDSG